MSLELDTSAFEQAVRHVEAVTGRTCAESINRAGLTAIIGAKGVKGAMHLTPVAVKSKILAVTDRQLAAVIVTRAKKAGKWPMSQKEIKAAMKKERAKRVRASGYTAFAGWSNAAKAMGGKGVKGVDAKRFGKSQARHGSGTKATPARLMAEIVNTAPMAEAIGFDALQQGLDNAAADLEAYATRKMQQTFDRARG